MQKIVINRCYGGFSLSPKALHTYNAMAGTDHDPRYSRGRDIPRDCRHLVQVVERMGKKANGSHAELKVIEIPDDVDWVIEEYDGCEWISEKHRVWGID
jgi:hypothetical protein